jgi:hypothetical protein
MTAISRPRPPPPLAPGVALTLARPRFAVPTE